MSMRTLANTLREVAQYLDSVDDFELESIFVADNKGNLGIHFFSKEEFVKAVKAVGSSKKTYGEGEYGDLRVSPNSFPSLSLRIPRSAVCKKVVKFECEPLFSEAELEKL